jgi:hypothetical protein
VKSKNPIPNAGMNPRCWWITALLALTVIGCGTPSGIFVSDAQAWSCVNLAEQMEKGEEGFAFISPPGFQIRMMPYETPSGTAISGLPSAVDARQTEGWGNGLYLDHVSFALDFGSLECVYLRFRYTGGSWYLNINGQSKNFGTPQEMHGATLGGVRLYLYPDPRSSEGYLVLSGKIGRFTDSYGKWASLIIGGQQLTIGDICAGR